MSITLTTCISGQHAPRGSSLIKMTLRERCELAAIQGNATARYETLWPDAKYYFPTLMLIQQLTNVTRAEDFRFHIKFYPLRRSPVKMKYRASIETGAGTFLNDALPENLALQLQNAAPQKIELPSVIF